MKQNKKMEIATLEIATLIAELEEHLGLAVDRYGELGLIVDAHRVFRFGNEAEFIDALYGAVESSSAAEALEALGIYEI